MTTYLPVSSIEGYRPVSRVYRLLWTWQWELYRCHMKLETAINNLKVHHETRMLWVAMYHSVAHPGFADAC